MKGFIEIPENSNDYAYIINIEHIVKVIQTREACVIILSTGDSKDISLSYKELKTLIHNATV